MFSIIIPLYNKAAYIQKAIHSVMSQTYQEFEVIVVDDGSTDKSLKMLQSTIIDLQVPEEKIRIIEQENQGVSSARNNGVKCAKYEYIAFLDADDWWEATYLEEMKKLIEDYRTAGIYGCGYYKVKNGNLIEGNVGVDSTFISGEIDYFKVYAKTMYMPLCTSATVVRKDVFINLGGFKPKLKAGEDFDLWVRIVRRYPVAILKKPLAFYNQDVELQWRAVGARFYQPEEHMIFTDYGDLNSNSDFIRLYEILAVYSLLTYYLAGKNKSEVSSILKGIHWQNHSFKYRLYYRLLPKYMVKFWFWNIKVAVNLKNRLFG